MKLEAGPHHTRPEAAQATCKAAGCKAANVEAAVWFGPPMLIEGSNSTNEGSCHPVYMTGLDAPDGSRVVRTATVCHHAVG